jgi:hypothetical protein
MRVAVMVGLAVVVAALSVGAFPLFTSKVGGTGMVTMGVLFYLFTLAYLGYGLLYFATAYLYPGVEVRVEPEIVDPGDTVRLHVDLSGEAAFEPDQVEAFLSKRRIYRGINRGLFNHSGWMNPRLLFERTRSLDDASPRDGTFTVEFHLPEQAAPTSHDHHEFTGFNSVDRWDVGIRIQAAMYPGYHFFVPFVIRRPDWS